MRRTLSNYCGVFVTIYSYIIIGLSAYLWQSQLFDSNLICMFTFCLPIASGILTFVSLISYNLKEFLKKSFKYLWMSLLTIVILEVIIGVYRSLFLYSLGAVWATDAQLGLGEMFALIITECLHLGLCIIATIGSGLVSFGKQIKNRTE